MCPTERTLEQGREEVSWGACLKAIMCVGRAEGLTEKTASERQRELAVFLHVRRGSTPGRGNSPGKVPGAGVGERAQRPVWLEV